MGLTKWALNRLEGSKAMQPKYRKVIELQANSSPGLNSEINKKMEKGYMLCGAPVQGRDGVWRATMQLNPQAMAELNDGARAQRDGSGIGSILGFIFFAIIFGIAFPILGVIEILIVVGIVVYFIVSVRKDKKQTSKRKPAKKKK